MAKKSNEIIIEKLEFPDNVRTRPGMYVGDLVNSNVLLREIIDNSIDEIYNKESPCNKIWIYSTNNYHIVMDNGRGIPITKSTYDNKVTMAYDSISSLHSGSKFSKSEAAIGLNGVGSSCFPGDQKVLTIVSGVERNRTIDELLRLKNSRYAIKTISIDKDGVQYETPIKDIFLTKHTNELIELEFEDGSSIRCTPDHKFLLTSGEYKEAKDLTEEDEIQTIQK